MKGIKRVNPINIKIMQKYKQAAIAIAFLTIILSAGICNGVPSREEKSKRQQNQKIAILEAFENGDYESWRQIISAKGEVYGAISEEDFNKFVKARQAARSGDYEQAINLSAEVESELKEKLGETYFS